MGPIHRDINEYDMELGELKDRLERKKRDLDDLEEEIRSLEHEINDKDSAHEKKKLIERLEKERGKRDDLKNEIGKIENRLSDYKDKEDYRDRLGSIQKEIDDIKKTISSENIDTKKEELEDLISENQELRQKSEDLKEKLAQTVSMGVGGSLGEAFANRKVEIESKVKKWRLWTGVSIGLLIISSIGIYADLVINGASNLNIISKIALILPVSVAVWFTSSNYNRERRLMEEYAFKSTLSFSLDGYRKVLQEELPNENKDQLGDFLTEAMLGIYENPYSNIQPNEDEAKDTSDSTINMTNKQLIKILRKISPDK